MAMECNPLKLVFSVVFEGIVVLFHSFSRGNGSFLNIYLIIPFKKVIESM